jgi:hypothetical protein
MNKHILFTLLFVTCGIFSLSSCSCGSSRFENYQDAVNAGDFTAAYLILDEYHKEYFDAIAGVQGYHSSPWSVINGDGSAEHEKFAEARAKYWDAFDYIYKAEIRQIITSIEGQDACDKIVFLLDEIPVDGKKYQPGLASDGVDESNASEFYDFEPYKEWTQHFNGLCNSVLTLAINRKNKVVAQQILLSFVDNVEVYRYPDEQARKKYKIPNSNNVYIDYTKKDAQAAKEKYDNAVAMGMFE